MVQAGDKDRPGRPWGTIRASSQEGADLARFLRTMVDQAPQRPTLKTLAPQLGYSASRLSEFLSGSSAPPWPFVETLITVVVPEAQRSGRLRTARKKWAALQQAPASPAPVVITPSALEQRQTEDLKDQLIVALTNTAALEREKAAADKLVLFLTVVVVSLRRQLAARYSDGDRAPRRSGGLLPVSGGGQELRELEHEAQDNLHAAQGLARQAAQLLGSAWQVLDGLNALAEEFNARGADIPTAPRPRPLPPSTVESADAGDVRAVLQRAGMLLSDTAANLARLHARVQDQRALTTPPLDPDSVRAQENPSHPQDNPVTSQDAPSGGEHRRRRILLWAVGAATGAGAAAAGVWATSGHLFPRTPAAPSPSASASSSRAAVPHAWTWKYQTAGQLVTAPSITAATAVVLDGAMTVSDTATVPPAVSDPWGNSQVYAVDLATGHLRWQGLSATNTDPVCTGAGLVFTAVYPKATNAATRLLAYDALTGHQRWQFANGKQLFGQWLGDDGVLYVTDGNLLYACDPRSGTRRWQVEVGTWGGLGSPWLVCDDTIYVQDGNQQLFALKSATGAALWSTDSPQITPLRLSAGHLLLGQSSSDSDDIDIMRAVSGETGKQLWKQSAAAPFHWPGTVAAGLYLLTDVTGTVTAWDVTDGRVVWKSGVGGMPKIVFDRVLPGTLYSRPVIANGLVYLATAFGVCALDIRTGHQRWRGLAGGPIMAPPLVAAGTVLAPCEDGQLYAFDARTGKRLWTLPTGAALLSSPVLNSGWLVVAGSDRNLYGLKWP